MRVDCRIAARVTWPGMNIAKDEWVRLRNGSRQRSRRSQRTNIVRFRRRAGVEVSWWAIVQHNTTTSSRKRRLMGIRRILENDRKRAGIHT